MIAIIAPSLDDKRIYPVHQLSAGAVHRSRVVLRHASGKGANAARAAAKRGASVTLCALAGEATAALLADQLGFLGVRLALIPTRAATRSCVTVLEDDGRATELVQEALPVEDDERDAFIQTALECIDGADAVLLAGSLPPGIPQDFYQQCVRRAAVHGIPVVIDVQGPALLAALPGSDAVVKINREEFNALGQHLPDSPEGESEIACALLDRGARSVIVSNGPLAVRMWENGRGFDLPLPEIQPVNPVGSGDAMSGGITLGLSEGRSLGESVGIGISMGIANARTLLPGDL
ncbi:MAG: PfkB family carbohydrate kinase [Bacteroidota bacterium]